VPNATKKIHSLFRHLSRSLLCWTALLACVVVSLPGTAEAQASKLCTSWKGPDAVMRRKIQQSLKEHGLYSSEIDGSWETRTTAAIQKALAKWQGYNGRTDGSFAGDGVSTCKGVQMFAKTHGGYNGPIDGIPGPGTWSCFLKALEKLPKTPAPPENPAPPADASAPPADVSAKPAPSTPPAAPSTKPAKPSTKPAPPTPPA